MKTLREELALSAKHRDSDGGTPLDRFVFTFELVPARASRSKVIDRTLNFAREAARDGRLTALSLTDNAGGHPALTPTSLGKEIRTLGIEPVIHFSCKDKNRNLIESQLFELDRGGLNTLLIITGDYPRYGFRGRAKPVYDLDSVLVLGMIEEIRKGLVINSQAPGGGVRLDSMNFHAGCVVSPFKMTEAEQIQQYLKLKRKIRAGADFIITQMGFDAEKYHELRQFLDLIGVRTPLIGTVFIPGAKLARIINKGIIPGCTMPDRLLEVIIRESKEPDCGISKMIERAAKQVAILAGMGYQGAHLSGPGLEYEQIGHVMDLAQQMYPAWRELASEFSFPEEWEFWLFDKGSESALSRKKVGPHTSEKIKPHAAAGRLGPNINKGRKKTAGTFSPAFIIGRAIHNLFFEPGGPFFNPASSLLTSIKNRRAIGFITALEYFFKGILYDCYSCGDCYLADTQFLCPQSQCAKRLLNGPCGGSKNGWCEVWPEKKRCLYVRQYERMSGVREMLFKELEILPPRDWGLDRSSSWINFFSGRDHHRLDVSRRGENNIRKKGE